MDILIAEDGFISRNLLQKMLVIWGHKVLVAEDDLEAWEPIYYDNWIITAKHNILYTPNPNFFIGSS